MKKRYAVTLIVLAFVVGMLSSGGYFAGADQSISVWINGKPLNSSPGPREIDGRVFVPLRAVSESMGATVGWDDATNTAYIATQRDALTDIEIVGDASFQKEMRDALQLLKDKDPEDYRFVGQYVRKIVLDNNSRTPRTMGYDMIICIPDTWKPDAYWWAGCFRHEAQHIYQTYNSTHAALKVDEMEAWKKEMDTLYIIDAPQWMIDYYKKVPETKWWEQSPLK